MNLRAAEGTRGGARARESLAAHSQLLSSTQIGMECILGHKRSLEFFGLYDGHFGKLFSCNTKVYSFINDLIICTDMSKKLKDWLCDPSL